MSDYFNKLKDSDVRERYTEKIRLCEGIDPYLINFKESARDPSMLPSIDMDIISDYLLMERSWYTGEAYSAKKSMDAVNIFLSRWILDVVLKVINSKKVLIVGQVFLHLIRFY